MKIFMTLLVDSVRLLRARALFWVTLWISAFVALLYLSIGFNPEGFSLLFGLIDIPSDTVRAGSPMAEMTYLWIFSNGIVGVWLSIAAVILALISCASIFPDFMAEGSIGIPLSKPVSRLTLFFCKYVGSLLFVIVQVALFCAIVFLALRWRVGTWNPSVFWAVPLVTLVFSYIYSVVVLFAVKTRSVLAAVLAGVAVWFLAWAGQAGEGLLYMFSQMEKQQMEASSEKEPLVMEKWHQGSVVVMGFLPKTGQTMQILDRLMVVKGEGEYANGTFLAGSLGASDREARETNEAYTRHSKAYIIWTSLGFEAVMLGLAAFIFCRRDY
jgi:ABC-type transport system involved in multi-copper enzyme maturation permease subunit